MIEGERRDISNEALSFFTVGELAALLEHIHGNVALIMEEVWAFALNSKLSQLYVCAC